MSEANRDRRFLIYGLLGLGMALFFGEQALYCHWYGGHPQLTYHILHLTDQIDWEADTPFAHAFRTNYYPPLYDVFMDLAYRACGCDYQRIVVAQAPFFLLAALYLTFLARRLRFGAFSAVPGLLLLVAAGVVQLMQNFSMESLLTLPICAYAYHLVAADGFRDRRHAALAGVWMGVGLLTKWSFLFYTGGLTLLAVAAAFYDIDRRRLAAPWRRQWANFGVWAACWFAVAGWWYALFLPWDYFFKTAANDPNTLEKNWLITVIGSRPLGAAALAGVLFSRRPWRLLGAAALAVGLPTAIFISFPHTEARYYWPLAAAFSFCAALPLAHLRRDYQKAAYLIVVWAMALNVYFGNVGVRWEPSNNNHGSEQLIAFLDRATPHPPNRALRLASHPLWDNEHIKDYYLKYYMRRLNLWDTRFRIDRHYFFFYSRFHEMFLRDAYDIVLTDCGKANACMETRKDFVRTMAVQSQTAPFVDMATGQPVGAFGGSELEADIAKLAGSYRLLLTFPLNDGSNDGKGSYTRVYMKRELFAR